MSGFARFVVPVVIAGFAVAGMHASSAAGAGARVAPSALNRAVPTPGDLTWG